VGFGLKNVIIETSQDSQTWIPLGDDGQYVLDQAAGQINNAANSQIALDGTMAQSVRITVVDGWGVFLKQYGLSEVQFMAIPAQAREPRPANGQVVDARNPLLTWRKGRGSVTHDVLIATDPEAVVTGTAQVITVSDSEVDSTALDLNFGETYYWQVNEVNAGGEVMTGDLWQFTVKDSFQVEDFEAYTNESPDRPFQTWIDGFGFTQPEPGNPGNGTGSAVGHDIWAYQSPYTQIMERNNVFSGSQALPMYYDNSGDHGKAKYSEIERIFGTAQDWDQGGANTLTLHVYGTPQRFVEAADSILMSGAGADIWNTADEFRFAWKQLTGDGTIIARVDSLINTHAWAKAGVMIRETLDPGSTNAGMYYAQENGVRLQARLLVDTAAQSQTASLIGADQTGQRAPVWVKLERKGNDFTAYYSQDGQNWTVTSWGTQTISMVPTVYIGLAVTSHNPGMTTAAEFSDVEVLGNVTGAWQIEDVGVSQPSNTAAPLYVALQDSSQRTAVVTHENPNAVTSGQWLNWAIPMDQFTGVNAHAIKKIMIGVGDRKSPQAGAQGMILIDEISVGTNQQ
jgi:regulation of enolase protein 1 (concanavalin A-like superfamily)